MPIKRLDKILLNYEEKKDLPVIMFGPMCIFRLRESAIANLCRIWEQKSFL